MSSNISLWFLMILQPHSKFEPSKSIFSEISRFHGLIPITACRSAKMAAKHLWSVPLYSICIVLGPWDLVKVMKKSVPEKSKYGAASHLKNTVARSSFLSKLWSFLIQHRKKVAVLKMTTIWKKWGSHNCDLKVNGV